MPVTEVLALAENGSQVAIVLLLAILAQDMVRLVLSRATASLAPEVHLFVIDKAERLLNHLLVDHHLMMILLLMRGRRIRTCVLGQASHVHIGGEMAALGGGDDGVRREEHVVVFHQRTITHLGHRLARMPSEAMWRVVCHV